jgi:hypothetical protein
MAYVAADNVVHDERYIFQAGRIAQTCHPYRDSRKMGLADRVFYKDGIPYGIRRGLALTDRLASVYRNRSLLHRDPVAT